MEPSRESLLEMNLLGDLHRDLEVLDVSLMGRRFTWYHPNGQTISRIDRALISEEWEDFLVVWLFGHFQDMCLVIVLLCLDRNLGIRVQNLFDLIIIGSKIKV